MKPRIFIGTMYCGEGDYRACCEAIQQQEDVTVHQTVISNLDEKTAHNALWNAWRSERQTFDMFVKVDADTVLAHPKVLLSFWNMMQSNSRITGIQAPLLDYFTDGFINGLNCFSPKVTFLTTTDELYCDRVDVDHDIVIKSKDVIDELKPAGYHCYQASELQSFHYGIHRKLKNQHQIINLVRSAWNRLRDRNRGFALLGAEVASNFAGGGFNYTDQKLLEAFKATHHRYDDLISKL